MDMEDVDLDKLMVRLLNAHTREAARQEIQSWPLETAAAMINLAAKREYDKTTTRSSQLRQALQRLWPTRTNLRFPTPYDMLVIAYADQMQDSRFLTAVLNVLSRYYADRKLSVWHSGAEEQDSPSPYWSSGMMMKLQPFRFKIEGLSTAIYQMCERPLTAALLRLLPQVEPEKRSLTSEQQQTVLQLLRFPYRDVELTLCLLEFLASVGDKEVITPVEQIHHTALETENGKRVRMAAKNCLVQARVRVRLAAQSQILLRPANNHSLAAPEMLLRPASGDAAASPDELLRPTANEATGR